MTGVDALTDIVNRNAAQRKAPATGAAAFSPRSEVMVPRLVLRQSYQMNKGADWDPNAGDDGTLTLQAPPQFLTALGTALALATALGIALQADVAGGAPAEQDKTASIDKTTTKEKAAAAKEKAVTAKDKAAAAKDKAAAGKDKGASTDKEKARSKGQGA